VTGRGWIRATLLRCYAASTFSIPTNGDSSSNGDGDTSYTPTYTACMGDLTPQYLPARRRTRRDRLVQVIAGLVLFSALIALFAFGLWWGTGLGPLDL
jgi:hypothetical protein